MVAIMKAMEEDKDSLKPSVTLDYNYSVGTLTRNSWQGIFPSEAEQRFLAIDMPGPKDIYKLITDRTVKITDEELQRSIDITAQYVDILKYLCDKK